MIDAFVKLRKDKELTQRDLAKLLHVSNCCVARIETRELRVDLIEIIDYLRALGLSNAEIIDFISVIVEKC